MNNYAYGILTKLASFGITSYEQGFLTKCAEYGVDGRCLLMIKVAKPTSAEKEYRARSAAWTPAQSSGGGAYRNAYPRLPGLVPVQQSNMGPGESPYLPSDEVRHFFDRLATPGRIRYNKTNASGAANAYDGLLYPGFYNDVDARLVDEMPEDLKTRGAVGYATRSENPVDLDGNHRYIQYRPQIRLMKGKLRPDLDSIAVHEYTHGRANHSGHYLMVHPENRIAASFIVDGTPSGVPDDMGRRLESVYNIAGRYSGDRYYDIAEENPTTHAEHQFRWMLKGRRPSGGLPELPEYEETLRNAALAELKRERSHFVNGYDEDVLRQIKQQYVNEAYEAFRRDGAAIPDVGTHTGRVTVLTKPPDPNRKPWPVTMSLDEARKSEWYKADPEIFEEYFADPQNVKFLPFSNASDGELWFDPKSMYESMWRRRYIDRKYGEGTYDTGVSDEDAERYRNALINLWSMGEHRGDRRVAYS